MVGNYSTKLEIIFIHFTDGVQTDPRENMDSFLGNAANGLSGTYPLPVNLSRVRLEREMSQLYHKKKKFLLSLSNKLHFSSMYLWFEPAQAI